MRETRRDALPMRLVVEVVPRERNRVGTGADDAASRSVAHDTAVRRPLHLEVRLAAGRLAKMHAALLQVIADEREVLVTRGIAGHAP